jgi:hypothetical protein
VGQLEAEAIAQRSSLMDKSENASKSRPTVKPTIELDDQTKRAAILEIARRLELVRAETHTGKRTRREPRVAPTTTKG